MNAKHYRDTGGLVWARVDRNTYRCVRGRDAVHAGDYVAEWELNTPLTEVNPYADETTSNAIRAELAIVLTELADEIYSPYEYSGVDEDIRLRLRSVLYDKSVSLRASLGMES
ncbi:hypothetical protein ACFQ8W_00340 [Streptomyces sp. NPDC056508]|uniref:hypothetical protein n=1 Tax=Streptomyces sp. NPDC056508 TaxID=3345845 RepID=UPI0036A0A440